MTDFDNKTGFDEFLAHRPTSTLRFSEHDRLEPPPELDRLILHKAREAIERPSNAVVYRAPKWAFPFALAASAVLAFIFAVTYGRLQPITGSASTEQQFTPHVAAAPASRGEPLNKAAAAAESEGAPLTTVQPPATPRIAAAQDAPPISALSTAERPVAPMQMPPAVTSASDATNAARAVGDSELVADYAPRIAQPLSNETRVIAPVKGGLGVSSAMERSPMRATQDVSAGGEMNAAQATDSSAATPPGARAGKHADPKAWLREIEQLRAAGRFADADRELAAFRKAFPGEAARLMSRDPRPAR